MGNSPNTFTGYLGADFQLKLFWQILTEYEFGNEIFSLLEVSYFDDSTHKQFFISLKNYFNENERVPNIKNKSIYEAINEAKHKFNEIVYETHLAILDKIIAWNEMCLNGQIPFDGDVIQKNTYQFIKQQEYRKLASYILDKTKEGSIRSNNYVLNEIDEKIKKIHDIGLDEDDGIDVFHDIDSVLEKDYREPIPTGILAIDELMGGGLGKGEIGIILAGTGVGKSTLLTKISNTALNHGKKVLQIIFEDKPKDIQRKHFAIWSGVKLSKIDSIDNVDFVKEKAAEHQENIRKNGGMLSIKRFLQDETDIIDIKKWIQRTEKKFGFKYDLLVLDYIDCLEPHKKGVDLHQSELAIIKTFESMAEEFNIPQWTAIQGNRGSTSAEYLTIENMGGNVKRAQKSHFLMSVAKTPDQKLAGTANMSILKARFAQDGQRFEDCIFNNDTMEIRITDSGYKKTTTIPKYNKEDLKKIEDNQIKYHEKLSQKSSDDPQDSNNVNEKAKNMLDDYKKMKEAQEKGLTNEDENLRKFMNQKRDSQGDIKKDDKKS